MDKLQLISHKITDITNLERICSGWRLISQNIVFTNGCFDIIHQGHINSLAQAASLGNRLVVGINADASVTRLKGPQRPINDAYSRALVLAAMQFVDAVCIFDEDTPLKLIEAVRPHVLAKGGDYTPETVVGNDFVQSIGGQTVILPLVPNFSTTSIIEKSKQS
ncbi:D-glycero-beta-D-manno-heptose 1-phosphate adenylyltransferase [Taibaiella sp. KBW10]|uniref:D-glycero-beta-D-manno-heptose 1-phosphate adenylyltransferase n=1 Tax=Taibaiella sp. KBW10 TaxID=2153357 RepID=UPI000F5A0785|nr:D-glycero-beta-D-manno-heptose 1-phosphate adenylyltransferase [Taibaiella sp. KBW10]RQO32084.1 D-glycero-beta-D-manno-heptose 1-phosphate adenylyltransferase [Taibaiella sp. KBW10]